jgi:uncharacterized glyoxalase superfamily protein PhnB
MLNNRSVPPALIVPVLPYPDVRRAAEFLVAAFGFVERTRIGDAHRVQLAIGDAAVIVADRGEVQTPTPGARPLVVRIRVDDVDAAFARACEHGALVVDRPVDREYGERDCTLRDIAGYHWQLAQTTGDVAPEEYGCETVTPWPAYGCVPPTSV